jgi:hypothetical protein
MFHLLWQSRFNDTLPEGTKLDRLEFSTLDGKKFSTDEINIPTLIVFFNTKSFFTSNVYPNLFLKSLPELAKIEEAGYINIIVLLDTEQSEAKVKKILSKKKYKVLENRVFLGNTKQMSKYLGVKSWPHSFLLDKNNTIIYQNKIPSAERILGILRGV